MENKEIIKKLEKLEKKLPKSQEDYAAKYAYLYTKASLFLYYGAEKYRKNDYFHYPRKNWQRKPLKDIAGQITNKMAGISRLNPIQVKSLIPIFQSMQLFHFDVANSEVLKGTNILKVGCEHILDHEALELYFEIGEKKDKS